MPFLGIGAHVLVALFFAIHAVRTRRELYWLFILFSFPLLGSLVYFLMVYLPESGLDRGLRRAAGAAARGLDPGRALRDAREAFDLTPTAQNRMRLARALLGDGQAQAAAESFEQCLQGPFAADAEIRLGAAEARLAAGHAAAAVAHLEAIRASDPAFRAEQVMLALGEAYARCGRSRDAQRELLGAVERFGSVEARIAWGIFAASAGDLAAARAVREELARTARHWNARTRALHAPGLARLDAALAAQAPRA